MRRRSQSAATREAIADDISSTRSPQTRRCGVDGGRAVVMAEGRQSRCSRRNFRCVSASAPYEYSYSYSYEYSRNHILVLE